MHSARHVFDGTKNRGLHDIVFDNSGFSDLVFFEQDHDLKTGGWATAYLATS